MTSTDPASTPPPVPVQTLLYSIPVRRGRPGIVTAIGVLCIVIASLSGIASFGTGFYTFIFYVMSQSMAAISATSTSTATSSSFVATGSSSTLSLNGAPTASGGAPVIALPAGDVGTAVNDLTTKLALDPAHTRELNRLLRLHGRQVFGGDDGAPLTPATIDAALTQTTPLSETSAGAAAFSTEEGTVTLYADRAVFDSADGSQVIETSAQHRKDKTTQVHPPATASANTPAVATTTLTPAQVNRVVSAVLSSAATPPNAKQIQTIRAQLSAPNQSLVTPGSSRPVFSVFAQPNGTLNIVFDTGNSLVLSGAGTVISAGPPAMPKFNINLPLVIVLISESVASVGLAIYLLIVGIVVFRGSFAARRLLLIYAWVKIPLAFIAGIGIVSLAYGFVSGIAASTPGISTGPPPVAGFVIWGGILVVLGIAFPIGLLIAMRSRTVNDYYNAVATGDA